MIARPHGPNIEAAYIDAQIEPSGVFYEYTTGTDCCATGHVVFVPWKTVQRMLH